MFDAASSLHPAERPHWILNCSEAVWQLARDRVYELQRVQQTLAPHTTTEPGEEHSALPGRLPVDGTDTSKRQRLDSAREANVVGGPADAADEAMARSNSEGEGRAMAAAGPAGSDAVNQRALGLSASVAPVAGAKHAPPLSARCVLEESPKWAALRELLQEIEAKRDASGAGRALLVVRDERTGMMLRELVAHGARRLLEATFIRWVGRRRRVQQAASTVLSSRQHEARLLRAAADKLATCHAQQQQVLPRALPAVEVLEAAAQGGRGGGSTRGTSAPPVGGGRDAATATASCGGGRARSQSMGGRGEGVRAQRGSRSVDGSRKHGVDMENGANAVPDARQHRGADESHANASGDTEPWFDSTTGLAQLTMLDDQTAICTHDAIASEVLDKLQPRCASLPPRRVSTAHRRTHCCSTGHTRFYRPRSVLSNDQLCLIGTRCTAAACARSDMSCYTTRNQASSEPSNWRRRWHH